MQMKASASKPGARKPLKPFLGTCPLSGVEGLSITGWTPPPFFFEEMPLYCPLVSPCGTAESLPWVPPMQGLPILSFISVLRSGEKPQAAPREARISSAWLIVLF